MQFDFNDVLLLPAGISTIEHRSQINIYDEDGYLPIYTAPMFDVISQKNAELFLKNKINTALPRQNNLLHNVLLSTKHKWISVSLDNFIKIFICDDSFKQQHKNNHTFYILIDQAQGAMQKLLRAMQSAKEFWGNNLQIITGNIANPNTYELLSSIGVYGVRCSIGTGNACLTTVQTNFGYGIGSLIKDCYNISCSHKTPAKIICDGGIKNYADIITALALGADACMLGKEFNKTINSAGKCFLFKNGKLCVPQSIAEFLFSHRVIIYKEYRGMSTKSAQKEMGLTEIKTSEGTISYNKCEYYLSGWVSNFEHYLRSAMAYANAINLEDFIGNVEYNLISAEVFKRFNK
jgi:hypothetical protein